MGRESGPAGERSPLYELVDGEYIETYRPKGQEQAASASPDKRSKASKVEKEGSSTGRVKDLRQRLRQQGFVRAEVWIPRASKDAIEQLAKRACGPAGWQGAVLGEQYAIDAMKRSRQEGQQAALVEWQPEKEKLLSTLSDAQQKSERLTQQNAALLSEKESGQQSWALKVRNLEETLADTTHLLRKAQKRCKLFEQAVGGTVAAAVLVGVISVAWSLL